MHVQLEDSHVANRRNGNISRRQNGRLAGMLALLFAALVVLQSPALIAQEEEDAKPARPTTDELLPETTVAYLEIRNIQELTEKLQRGSLGMLLKNEKISGLVDELYEQGNDAFEENKPFEMTLEDIRSLPNGEITIAAVSPRLKEMCFIFIFEVDDENESVDDAIETIRDFAKDDGAEFDTEKEEDIEFHTITGNDTKITYFRRDGLLVASNNVDELKDLLSRWNGIPVEKVRPLKDNRKFATIMKRCESPRGLPSEIRGFIDPIEFAKSATRGQAGVQMAFAFLPSLGLDGVLAAGGSVILFEDDFESITHGHLLLASPRTGILDMIALKPGNDEPESWMPADSSRYITTVWDIPKFMAELEKLVDMVSGGEGTFRNQLETNINEEIGIDLEADVLDAFTGRITHAAWIEPPARVNSETNIISFEIKDEDKLRETLDILMDFAAEQADVDSIFDEKQYEGMDYWIMSQEVADREEKEREENRERMREWRRERAEQDGGEFDEDAFDEDAFDEDAFDEDAFEQDFDSSGFPLETRPMDPAFAIIGNCFVIGSPAYIEHVIDVELGKEASLADDEEYSTVMRKMTRLLDSEMPSVSWFMRPSVAVGNLIEVIQQQKTMELFDMDGVRDNDYAQGVRRAMDENPLPDFEEIEHLFPPQGGFVTSDDTGFHFLFFQMKVDDPDEEEDISADE